MRNMGCHLIIERNSDITLVQILCIVFLSSSKAKGPNVTVSPRATVLCRCVTVLKVFSISKLKCEYLVLAREA